MEKPKYSDVRKEMYPIAKKCIGEYYEKKQVNTILKECYIEEWPDSLEEKGFQRFTLVYPGGGDDWTIAKKLKTGKYEEWGHGTYFGRTKTKKQVLRKKK